MTTYRAWNLKPLDRSALKELTAAIAQQSTEELENRAMETMDGEPWSEEKYQMTLAAQQKETALLAGILAARGITDPADALTLLAGEEELSDPALLTDMEKACQRIWQAIDNGETIVVFGDYDVDGVTATALLYQHLKGMGAAVKCMLPSREGDGYGLSRNAIQSIHDKGYRLIVTVDNGISALEEAEFAASLGVDLIVTDHHLPHDTLPKAVAVVDPRRADDTSPFKGLCGAGVAFKLCAALDDCTPEEMLDYCGDLAAVGTVADVMPLTGENRALVKAGLHLLQHSDRPGLLALLDEVGLGGKPVTAENVSYAIAPRINAAGRMDSAVTALQLVLCEDEDRAGELAHKLSDINIQRQETEMEIVKAAQELLDACIAFSRRDDLLSDGWRFFLSDVGDAAAFKREMLQLVLQTYLAEFARDDGSVEIDTPAFRALLAKYEEALPAMERIYAATPPLPSTGYDLDQIAQTCLLSYAGATLLPQDEPGIPTAFLPLTVSPGDTPTVEADVTVFVINPASPIRDLALAYLETYAQNLPPHKRIQYIPAEASPIEQESYHQDKAVLLEEEADICSTLTHAGPDESMTLQTRLEAVRLNLADLEAHRYATTAEMIERYKALTPYLRIRTRTGLNFFSSDSREMVSLLNQYVQGAIDLEHFIARYAAMARMMQLER